MPIFFCGDISIDNYEFYGKFESALPDKPGTGIARQRRGSHGPTRVVARQFGGAYLLARFTGVAWSLWYGTNHAQQPQMARLQPWRKFSDAFLKPRQEHLFRRPRDFDRDWQLSYRLEKFKDDRFRVAPNGYEGFTLPLDNGGPEFVGPKELQLDTGSKQVLFVLNDGGGDARHSTKLADAIGNEKDCWIVMKIIDPPVLGGAHPDLMASLLAKKKIDRVVGIIPADELRKSGVPISRTLSWERTLWDVIDHVQRDRLLPGNTPPHLVITFDYDAVLYLKTKAVVGTANRREIEDGVLIFSIGGAEGEFANTVEGTMPGAQSVFVGTFSALLYRQIEKAAADKDPLTDIQRLLACALIAKRRFLQSGFAIGDGVPFQMRDINIGRAKRKIPTLHYSEGIFSYLETLPRPDPSSDLYKKAPDPFILGEQKVKPRSFPNPLEPGSVIGKTVQEHKLTHYRIPAKLPDKGFSIFKEVAGNKNLSDFRNYVLNEKAPEGVPIGAFDRIKTADVPEIEGLRTIGKLLQSYLSLSSGASKPLGIAVFGPPGAGKSTAVKCIIENLPKACKELVKDARHECNLAALVDPEDLAHYFQLARDATLRGKVPILFFDEFDCAVGGAEYFWLKHFLAPLQDGEFRSGHIVYPIGRAIFVFAGGVSKSFHDFALAMEANRRAAERSAASRTSTPHSAETLEPAEKEAGKGPAGIDMASGSIANGSANPRQVNFKGVDFLSRLHGHIDVAGLSPLNNAAFYPSAAAETAIVVDRSYLMRRAFTLRSVLRFHAARIFSQGSPQQAQIDPAIVDALLMTKTFKHGTRSMEAIIRMSSLEGSDSFELSHLPPDNQLNMHVESVNFRQCLERGGQTLWDEYVAATAAK
jgi:hypothetical protein